MRIFVLEKAREQSMKPSHIEGLLQKITVLDAFDFIE
jgi:hypothetical protein